MPKAAEGENDGALHAALDVGALFGVKGKVVLVTGGGSGIGAMIASGFVQNGSTVYIASRKDCSSFAAQLTAKGPGSCTAISCDLTDAKQMQGLIETIEKAQGRLHVLVNNSGMVSNATLEKHTPEVFERVVQLNTSAVFELSRLAVPLLHASSTQEDPGRILNISSIHGLRAPAFDTFGYSASKAAVVMLSKHLAGALGPRHITVNSICPGLFASRMTRGLIAARGEQIIAHTALGRMGLPADVAGACIFLSGAAGAYVTGVALAVDGGWLIARPRL